ncbi:MAG: hypothetical protein ABSE63_14140 [Thermoguttaceae bacterium]|jgi:hypothetical protein
MPTSSTATNILNREFLGVRSKLIDLAASLDRIGRAQGSIANDPRMGKITQALQILAAQTTSRTEQIQILFSLPYDEHWR